VDAAPMSRRQQAASRTVLLRLTKASMSIQTGLERLTVEQFADRFRESMIPVSNTFSYFPALPLTEEEIREYLEEPISALPPAVPPALPKVLIGLVPYLERRNAKEHGKEKKPAEVVSFDKPPDHRQSWVAQMITQAEASLIFAIKDRQVSDYHYHFYHAIASLIADRLSEEPQSQFFTLLREELSGRVHGEVDQHSWHLKQALLRRQSNVRRETKAFREYARQSFIDTTTLYLHGICCDIDVETGPRQLPSRYLRRRLELLGSLYPPPDGYAVFPEELNRE
jgi:hypothetical protein